MDIPEIACAVDHDYAWKKVFRTEFLRDQSIHAGDFDIAENLIEFGARAMIAAKNIAFLDLKTDWDSEISSANRYLHHFGSLGEAYPLHQ